MTIDISANNPRISYSVAAGVTQTSFAVPFEFFDDSDLNVYIDTTLQTITTNYTVTGGAGSTGTVTMTVTGPKTVILTRDTTIERTTDFTAGVDINRAALNTQLDTLTAIAADNQDLGERSIRITDYDPAAANLLLPDAATRADKLLSFDTEGDIQVQAASDLLTGSILGANYTKASYTGNGTTTAYSTSVSAGSKNNIQVYVDGVYQNKNTFSISGSTLTFTEAPPLNSAIEFIVGNAITSVTGDASGMTYSQGDTGDVQRTVQSKLQELVSVKDFGAVGDGVTDDTAAIQAALDAANSSGKSVLVPNGKYIITSALTLYDGSTVHGEMNAAYHYTSKTAYPDNMPTLIFTNDTHGFQMEAGQEFRKVGIRHLAIYSTQDTSSTKSAIFFSNGNASISAASYEGVGNTVEEVVLFGWETGIKIRGAYSWFQKYNKIVIHNCKTGVDIEAGSAHHTKFDNIYINRNESNTWSHGDTTGVKLRTAGRVFFDNAVIENQNYAFELADASGDTTGGNYVGSNRQLVINGLYAEAMLVGVFRYSKEGEIIVNTSRCTYPFYSTLSSVVSVAAGISGYTQKSKFIARDMYLLGGASTDSPRRTFNSLIRDNSGDSEAVQFIFEELSVRDNVFNSSAPLFVNIPPNKIRFAELDNAGNKVTIVRNPSDVSEMVGDTTSIGTWTDASGAFQFEDKESNDLDLTSYSWFSYLKPAQEAANYVASAASKTSDTTLATQGGLSIEIPNDGVFEFEVNMKFYGDGSAAGGIKWKVDSTATFAGSQYYDIEGYVNGAAYAASARATLGAVISHSAISTASASPDYIRIRGVFSTTDTSPTSLFVQWAQNSSSTDTTYLARYSNIKLKRIG